MDRELLVSLCAAAERMSDVKPVDNRESERIIKDVASKHISDPDVILWWTALRKQPYVVYYEENKEIQILNQIIEHNLSIELIVTDEDDPRSGAAFRGKFDQIMEVVNEQRYFEYFLTPPDHSWLVFDTHHNELIFCGSIVERARELFAH